MPIYEFRCLSCNECFEILVMKKDEEVAANCPKCGPGVYLAQHQGRTSCGRCGYTEFAKK